MDNSDFYRYYEILFSLRKEYLKNQMIINRLLSYVSIFDNSLMEYSPNVIFETDSISNTDSLLLVISKRQAFIRLLFKSLYNSIVESDPLFERGKYLYVFRFTDDFVYLLDGNQDGRYLNSKVSITNPKEFIEIYKLLMKSVICKNGNTYFSSENAFVKLSNNGIQLLHYPRNDHRKIIVLDYDGIGDHLRINNASYMQSLMELKISKNAVPNIFRTIVDCNMEDYFYAIEGQEKKKMEYYEIDSRDKTLVLKRDKN